MTTTLRRIAGGAAVLALLFGVIAMDAPREVRHTDNIDKVDREVIPFGTDLAFHGDLAVAGQANWNGGQEGAKQSGVHLFERQDDGTLEKVGHAPCSAYHSDVDFVPGTPGEHGELPPEARPLYVVQSHDSAGDNLNCEPGSGKAGVRVLDATNPREPRSVGFAETINGAHNITAVGDTGLVYVSSYALTDPGALDGVSIVDVGADPSNPSVTFLEFPDADDSAEHENMQNESDVPMTTSLGCHDIGLDLEQDLAFCAGITETQIWDISDPRNPVIIEIIHNPDVSIHHGAQVNQAGDVLLVQDEWAGAAGHTTGCVAPNQPSGTIWFYDISDPRSAAPLGYWSAPRNDAGEDFCTTHFFGTFTMDVDGENRDMVATSYYDHGVWVVDFTNPTQPTVHAYYEPDGATFWAAYPWRGKLYANSFAPATLTGSDPVNTDKGGVYVFELDGYEDS